MLAHHALKAADLLLSTRRVTQLPINSIRPLSNHAAKPPRKNQLFSPKQLKKDQVVHRKECARDPSHPTHQPARPKTTRFIDASPSLASPSYIPNQLRSFQSSIRQRDISHVRCLWHNLEKDNLLHLLGPSDLESCSQLVIDLCPAEPSPSWSGPSRAAAEELALGLANRLSTSALRACFSALVIINDSEGILRLYDRFLSQIEHQNTFEDEVPFNSEETDELMTIPTIHNSVSPVEKELSIFAIMAHAIRDDFFSAIQMGLHSKWSLPPVHVADAFLDPFATTSDLRQKVLTYLRHANTARLLSRPSVFYRHLKSLVDIPATQPLQTLYATMVEGLSEHYPWAVLDSEFPTDDRPVTIPESIWAAFISAFLDVERLDLAESAWDDMIKYGHTPGPGVWAVLIKGVGKSRGSGPASTLWRSMKEASVSPDTSSYQAIVQVMVNARQWKDAAKFFDEFRSTSSLVSDPHNEPLFNTVIGAHLANSREPDALGLLEEMVTHGPHPTAVTFNAFLTYYLNNNDVKSLSSMLKKMVAYGVSGDVATFSILLCMLLRILDRGEAIRQTLAVMDQHKIKPNVATYTAIMTSLLQEKDKKALEASLDLLRTMEESGDPAIAPNVVTYTAVLSGIHHWIGKDDQLVQDCTELITRKMKTRRVKFNKVTYNMLLKTCLENPSPAGVQKALQFYRQMRRDRIPLTGDTWHIMLHGLARRGEWVLGHEVLRDMRGSGIKMTDWLENVAEEVARGYTVSRQRLASTRR